MEHLPTVLSRVESDALAARIEAHISQHGWGLWAVEIPGAAPFAGFVGLAETRFDAHFTPCTEVAWRLAAEVWGQGYATEGAQAVVQYACDDLRLREIVSFTVPGNLASRRVMERIGMVRDPHDDFDHPLLPVDSPLRRHVLYKAALVNP